MKFQETRLTGKQFIYRSVKNPRGYGVVDKQLAL